MAEPNPNEVNEQETRNVLLRKAYSQAGAQLRDLHKSEFNDLQRKAAAELGVEWSPTLTPAQKAAEAFDALLIEYPDLAARFTGGTDG